MIVTYVSTYWLQRQSSKDKFNSNEVVNFSKLHIEHTNSYDKTYYADFPVDVIMLSLVADDAIPMELRELSSAPPTAPY